MTFARLERRPGQHRPASTGPGGRRRGAAPGPAVDPIRARGRLQSLEKGFISAIVLEAEERPARPDREPGRRPERVARPRGQPVAQAEAQRHRQGVMHQIVEIDAVEPARPAPSGDLAVDVVEPEAQVGQQDPEDEAEPVTRGDRDGRTEAGRRGPERDLVRREAQADRRPGAIDRRGAGHPPGQPVADLPVAALVDPGPKLGHRGASGVHRRASRARGRSRAWIA